MRRRTVSSSTFHRLRRPPGRMLAALAALGLTVLAVPTALLVSPAAAAAGCAPDSGPNFSHRTVHAAQLQNSSSLHCADLAGSNLTGLGSSLDQADLTGANFTGANLSGISLIQATLNGANFTGANLSNDDLTQASLHGATFVNANVSGVDFTQAELQNANFDGATVNGASFDEADLGGTTFHNVKGVFPFETVILIVTGVIFLVLMIGVVRSVVRSLRISPLAWIRILLTGLIGSLMIPVGLGLFAGGLISQLIGPQVAGACNGFQCKVGVGGGSLGLTIGIPLFVVGLLVLLAGRRQPQLPMMGGGGSMGGMGMSGGMMPMGGAGPYTGGPYGQ